MSGRSTQAQRRPWIRGTPVGESVTHRHTLRAHPRVAVITSSLNPGTNDLWAAARPHVKALVIVGARSKPPVPLDSGVVALREMDAGRGLIWRHLVGLRRFMKSFAPDLVHLNGELWGVTAQESLRWGVPVVVHGAENLWEHGSWPERVARRRLVNRAVDRIAGYASWNHAGVDHVSEVSRRQGRSEIPTLVMPAIIPPAAFRQHIWNPPALETGVPLDILLVGRVVAMKGFSGALEAAARLTSRPVRMTVAGEGPELARLVAHASALGLELRSLGVISPEELAAIMARCHVQIQPSLTTTYVVEQFGRSVAEAITVGLPCLVSDSGELPRVVGTDPAAIFQEGNVNQLTDKLRDLAESFEKLVALSRRQRELAQRYEPGHAARAVLDFWTAALS